MARKRADPFYIPRRPVWAKFLQPSSIGILFAAILLAYPRLPDLLAILPRVDTWSVPLLPASVTAVVLGFLLGYTSTRLLNWFRWKVIRELLQYQQWMFEQKSFKTKVWGLLLKAFRGPGPFGTYDFEDAIPKQPLPNLNDTLNTYLKVAKPLVSPEDYVLTEEAVEAFRNNEGPKLQAHLQHKADTKKSWLADYWLSAAYLSSREPLAGMSNYYCGTKIDTVYPLKDPMSVAAAFIYANSTFHKLVSREKLQPISILGLVPMCMYGHKYQFNTVRIPDEYMDKLASYPHEKHIIVIRNGHYFKMNLYAKSEASSKQTLLTAEEMKIQLERISQEADALPTPQHHVASLTAQRRNVWAKDRATLSQANKDTLYAVESAMFHVSLETGNKVKDATDHARRLMFGDGSNRWFDKCYTAGIYDDHWTGFNGEHSFVDGTYFAALVDYVNSHPPKMENGELVREKPPRDLNPPKRMHWNLEGLEESIKGATEGLKALTKEFSNSVSPGPFGKDTVKKMRMSPDGFYQMMLQLAYYRIHKTITKTYEPATGRMFALGRTETIHPVSEHSVAFVKAIDDPSVPRDKVKDMLRKAVEHQTQFKLQSTIGLGCDRHLMGLYCAARELGMDIPQLYRDKVWQLPWNLSTSQTPVRSEEMGLPMDFKTYHGGFGAVSKEGYGVSYCIYNQFVNAHYSSWKSGGTDAERFAHEVTRAMEDAKTLMLS